MGLMLGNHITGIFIFPFIFLESLFAEKGNKKRALFGIISQYLTGLFIGLSVYWIIPFRARKLPPVNWGRIEDWKGFWWLVSGSIYQNRLTHISGDHLLSGIRLWSNFLLEELSLQCIIKKIVWRCGKKIK